MPPSTSQSGDCPPRDGDSEDSKSVVWMDPKTIKFSQATISPVFSRRLLQRRKVDESGTAGTYSEALRAAPIFSIHTTLDQLRKKSVTVLDIPPIRVCKHDGAFYSLDNRRLWVFREFGEPIPVVLEEEPSKELFQKLTRENDGESISIVDSQEKQAEQKDCESFLLIVLRWSIKDVMNERMYVNKVEKISTRFPSLKAYYKAFRYPLLEDTRGQIQHGLEAVGTAPYISLRAVDVLPSSNDAPNQLRKLKLTGRNFTERSSKQSPWKPKPTDLVVLCTLVPESLEDLVRTGEHYTLAEVYSADTLAKVCSADEPVANAAEDSPLFFRVIAYAPKESPEYLAMTEGKRNWYAVSLGNLATGIRIWEALNPHPAMFEDQRKLVEDTLYSEDSQVRTASVSEHGQENGLEPLVGKYCNYRQLNASQTEAVMSTVTGLLQDKGFRVKLIQGPPGTGKTSTLAVLVSIVSCLEDRTLVCAPTNRAVSEVAQRFLQQLKLSLLNTSQFSDFTSPASLGHRFCRPLQIGDVVMVGNEDRLETDGILGEIFLPHRKKRLLSALAPHSGWRHGAQNVVNFLRDAQEEFELYTETWKESRQEETSLLDFLQFIRKRLNLMGRIMRKNGQIMCDDLPSEMLSPDAREMIKDSCLVVDRLLKSLANENLTEADVRKCCTGACRSSKFDQVRICPYRSDFCSAKEELLELMRNQPGYFVIGGHQTPTEQHIEELCLKNACLVFTTTSSAGRWSVQQSGPFQCVVIDEAAQLVEAETAIVTQLRGVRQALLVGDPQQLQALVTSQVAKDCGYGRSLFERLQTLGHPFHILNVQYRMHPAISQFPNRQFYSGAVNDGPNVRSENFNKPYRDVYGPYAFIDVRDGEDEMDEIGKSWKNTVEAEVVQHLIAKIRAVAVKKSQNVDLGVITPYKAQVDLLSKRHFGSSTVMPSGASKRSGNLQIDVKTVDGFQGGEKDVILFSAVRANAGGHIGFVEDARRLNVALTRGRYCVWIIGNASTLVAHSRMWRALIEDAKRRHCFWDARDDQGLKKTIIRVKKELQQFAGLLENDSVLFTDTLWKIFFSKEFKEMVTNMKSTQNRQMILHTILRLANGKRSVYPTKCVSASENFSKMIHVQPTAGLILVWTIDVQKFEPVTQLIKVWNAVDSAHVPGLIRRLEDAFRTYTASYIERCSTLKHKKNLAFENKSKTVLPAVWKHDPSFIWHEASRMVREKAGAVVQENDLSHMESRLEKSIVEESILLMKFYSLTSGIARQLLTAVDGSNMELLFEVNEEEAAIIQYPLTTFILGRSGTGKTTIITTRLLKIEQQFKLAMNGLAYESVRDVCTGTGGVADSLGSNVMTHPSDTDYLRQVMVTLSPKLCAAIKRHIAKTSRTMLADYSTARDDDDKEEDVMLDEEEELKLMGGIPDTLVDISPNVFPLVITFRKFLAMVDGSVLYPFMAQQNKQLRSCLTEDTLRCEESEHSSSEVGPSAANGYASLTDEEDNEEEAGDINCHDSEDEDEDEDEDSENFSLNGDLASEVDGRIVENGKQPEISGKMTEVTFEHFTSCYWPHFSQDLIKKFDSSVVFIEIISFIKGSLEALHTKNGRLTRMEYLTLSKKRVSNFDEQQRDAIYSIFLLYERDKLARREYDIADYSMHLYGQMRLGHYLGVKFHYIYVDEVQDLTMAQIALFKHVCCNVQEGYVFAGDTAQTIARGVSFRFEDIRHLFYTEFLGKGDDSLERSHSAGHRALTCDVNNEVQRDGGESSHKASSKSGKATVEKTLLMPDLHHLSHNFRTHVGIVKIANSIVDLLHHFFPNSVDKLKPESSLLQGETPIFLEREENHKNVTSLFGHGGAAGGGGCDFGAEQVVLVRDAEAKRQMIEKLGKRGLVMSVLECKGLEFQDVLLYNFFSDSPLENKWRVIYSYMAENSLWEDRQGKLSSFPHFNMQKHNLLMSELKQLYVVVTRARQRLWIYDECPDHHKPMLDFWNQSGLVLVKRLDKELIQTIHGKSTPEDWKRRGIQMFNDHHYDMAELSFERAGDLHRAKWARAAFLQQTGEKCLNSDGKAGLGPLREAAEIFLSLEKGEAAARCYVKSGDTKKAGKIFLESCKPPRWEDAGDCYMEAKCWKDAANAYGKSFCVRQCLAACLRGKHLDLGVEHLATWDKQLNSSNPESADDMLKWPAAFSIDEFETLKTDYLKRCALHFHKQRDAESMMKYVRRFTSVNSQKVFLKRRDYFDELIEVEEGEGNFSRAAEMAEQKGDLKHAVKLLHRGGSHEQAVEKILERARFDMLWSNGKLGWPLLSTAESEDLLKDADKIASSHKIRTDLLEELRLLRAPGSGLENSKELRDSNNIRLQLMAGRQAIDELVLQYESNRARNLVPDLLLIWDIWSEKLISLIQAINRAQRRRDTVEDEILLECSNTYMGAVKHTQPHLFLVTDVATSWLQNSLRTLCSKQGQRGQIATAELYLLSEAFWATQLWQAGSEIIKTLEENALVSNDYETPYCSLRTEQMCKLYSITETLVDILSKNVHHPSIQEVYADLWIKLLRHGVIMCTFLFPDLLDMDYWDHLLTFRQEVGTVYDSIATRFVEGSLRPHHVEHTTYETMGRIQMLFPYLSRQWIRKYGSELQESVRQKNGYWADLWDKTYSIYGDMSEFSGQSPQNTCRKWVETTEVYCRSLQQVYMNFRKSIDPFTFIELLERGVVMDLACHTHLHSLILPGSLVINHMNGNNNTDLYSAMLKMRCTDGCYQFSTVRFVSRMLLDMLNSSTYQIEAWFEQSEIKHSRSDLIFRVVVSALTAFINVNSCTKGFHREIWSRTIGTLSMVLQQRNPLLQGLPPVFLKLLEEAFPVRGYPQFDQLQHHQLRLAFMRAMAAVKDPLVVLKIKGMRVSSWAHESKLRYIILNQREGVFGTTFSARKKPILVSKQKNGSHATVLNTNSPDLEAEGQSSEGHRLDTAGAQLRTSPDVPPSDEVPSSQDVPPSEYLDTREELGHDEEEPAVAEDAWIAGDPTDEPSPGCRAIPVGHVSIGDGESVPMYIRSRLQQLLEEARQRLKEELSATERYKRDTRAAFRKQNIQSREYLEVFLSKACPLKADADDWLQTLETSVQALKDDTNVEIEENDLLMDEMADSQDNLLKLVACLDPRNKEHKSEDRDFLEEKLVEVEQLLEAGKKQFLTHIRNLERSSKDSVHRYGNISSNNEDGKANTSVNQAKSGNGQKKKPHKKKKKKGKKH